MKGIQGLIIAIGLGIVGAIFNFAYLGSKARELETVDFIGIKSDVTVARGERLSEAHLDRVAIPHNAVHNLKDYAYLYSDRNTVVGQAVWRVLEGGSILLRNDLKTPPQELTFGQDVKPGVEELALGVPIDSRKLVPSLIVPGDTVSFVVSQIGGPTLAPTPAPAPGSSPSASDSERLTPTAAAPNLRPGISGNVELIGPFKILSLGNRLGSPDVMRASRTPQVQENVMMILVRKEGGQLEPEAVKLLKLLDETNSRPLGYLLHPRTQKTD